MRILVVDDDPSMVDTLVAIFKIKGCKARGVYSGPEALKRVRRKRYDCVLTDIVMPEMSGVELCRAIKKRRPNLPVVLMTAYSNDRLIRQGLEEGAVTVLTKPFSIDDLLTLITSLR